MRAGLLRHSVTLVTPVFRRDEFNQKVETEPDTVTVAAAVQHVSGGETVRGRQMEAGARELITIRWRDGITNQTRVQYRDRTLSVIDIAEDQKGRHRELMLQCAE